MDAGRLPVDEQVAHFEAVLPEAGILDYDLAYFDDSDLCSSNSRSGPSAGSWCRFPG
jgi:hypothetical protein